jgi:hypothetical protein
VLGDGRLDRRIDREVEPRRHRHRAEHPHRVFLEALFGHTDAADDPRPQILEAAGVVDDRKARDVVEEGVDREVAAEGVLLGVPKVLSR